MKPINTNNLSFWGYIGLLILFHLPYVGDIFLFGFAIFGGKSKAGKFARIILIIQIVLGVILGIAGVFLGGEIFNDFGFPVDEGIEVFRNIAGFIG